MHLQCGRFRLALERPLVMGIVNVTPDSFSDGGQFSSSHAALEHARRLIDEGADIIDVGAESTRPGSADVALDEERRRVLPVIEQLAAGDVPVSADTRKPELMRDAIAAGAAMINDINGGRLQTVIDVVASSNVGVCLMHMQGTPVDMQINPRYHDVVAEVFAFLNMRVQTMNEAGVTNDRIVVDPGFGFGKTLEHNLALLRKLADFRSIGTAVLAGISRKGMLGRITGRELNGRVYASVAAAMIAVERGAHIVRVHDVAATRDALAVLQAVKGGNS
jgi:dihydropteroate synthase